jgi:aryl-alcohol dehydrogenase-like predicted oxidoreductase
MSASPAAQPSLKKVYLGASGTKVSELCLGAMTFSLETGPSKGWGMPTVGRDDSFAILNRFAEVGGSFIDTADAYGQGDSEKVVGEWLQTKTRSHFEIATKVRWTVGAGHNDVGLSRRHLIEGVESSLRNLKTDYIDLYQSHAWDAGTPLEETLRTYSDLVRSGKVRYIGVSNYSGWQFQKALDYSRFMGLEKYITYQGQYSLLCRNAEKEILPAARAEGVGYLPWSPLKGGWLAGRYTREAAAAEAGSRVGWAQSAGWKETDFDTLNTEKTFQILDEVRAIAKEHNQPIAAVSLRWVMQRPGVTSTIIGARNLKQLEENLAAATFTLTHEQMDRLNKVSAVPGEWPYAMLDMDNRGVGSSFSS